MWIFSWIRESAKNAVLGGIEDAARELRDDDASSRDEEITILLEHDPAA